MPRPKKHKWTFAPRFRRNAFGWRSQPAAKRVREAVSEIKKAARKSPMLGAEGAVLFLERVSPALAHVDTSSGSIGSAVNRAIVNLPRFRGHICSCEQRRSRCRDPVPHTRAISERS